jgi:hypothetical protein
MAVQAKELVIASQPALSFVGLDSLNRVAQNRAKRHENQMEET